MKIGLVCPYNIVKGGGVQEIVLALQKGLKRKGHDAKIITPLPRDIKQVKNKDIIFIGSSTDFRSPTHTTAQVSVTLDTEKLDAILEKENFDILHFHEPWVPVISKQILQRSHSVNIATFHAKVPETQMIRTVAKVFTPYLKSVMSYLNVLTAVSDSGAEYVRSLTDQKINIIPNGVDLSVYKYFSKKDENDIKSILFIGRLERRKGVKYLIKAFQLLNEINPNVRLIIAGDGPERERLKLLSEDLKINNISFLGYITEKQKLKLLHETDLFCSPAIFGESFGIVLLEAMACGRVIVAGNNSGYIDVMNGTGAISIVNPHDAAEFARRLNLLLVDKVLQDVWQKWALKRVKEFDYTKIVDLYEKLYIEALKDNEHS